MNIQTRRDVTFVERHLPFDRVALVLQGGGALGAYQAGVYEALVEGGIHPNWIAGISIGAINAAIIAGNPLNSRVDRLRQFWTQVSSKGPFSCFGGPNFGVARGDMVRLVLTRFMRGVYLTTSNVRFGQRADMLQHRSD